MKDILENKQARLACQALAVVVAVVLSGKSTNLIYCQSIMTVLTQNNPRSLFVNPAMGPEQSSFLSLPILGSFDVKFSNSFTFSSVMDEKNNAYYLNTSALLAALSKSNNFTVATSEVDVFHFGLPLDSEHRLSFSLRNRINVVGVIPHDMAELVLANPLNKSKVYDISSDIRTTMWNEIGICNTYKMNENVTLGGRLKFVSGIVNFETEKLSYNIEKFQDYYLLSSNLNIKTTNINGSNIDIDSWFNNPGIGVDLGFQYKTDNKRFGINASILDFGVISWSKSNSSNIISKHPNNKYKFDGFGNLEKTLNNEEFALEELFDSVLAGFKNTAGIETIEDYSYTSMLPTTFQVVGIYAVNDNLSHNVSVGFEGKRMTNEKFYYAISGGYCWLSPNKTWQLLASYTYYNNSSNGFGGGVAYSTDKFQVYLGLDNVVAPVAFLNSNYAGLNLSICWYNL